MIDIKWLQTDVSKAKTPCVIIAISNTGLVKYKNGDSIFGNKYFEHYGYSNATNPKQYHNELNWYLRHNNKCRWE